MLVRSARRSRSGRVLYLSLKALHIVGFVAWFAGIFYIWRLFVNQVETAEPAARGLLLLMARRLYKYIMRTAAIVTLTGGLGMLAYNWDGLAGRGWIWVKLALVALLLANHLLAGSYLRRLEAGERFDSSRRFRVLNELPTLLLLGIVILAVFRPF